nr:uncharacterized protein LOC129255834 [Lytechinus pictus]
MFAPLRHYEIPISILVQVEVYSSTTYFSFVKRIERFIIRIHSPSHYYLQTHLCHQLVFYLLADQLDNRISPSLRNKHYLSFYYFLHHQFWLLSAILESPEKISSTKRFCRGWFPMESKLYPSSCPLYLMIIVVVISIGPHCVIADFQCIRSQCFNGAPTFENALRLKMDTVESALRQCFPSFSFTPGVSDAQIADAIGHLRKCNRHAATNLSRLVQSYHTDLVSGWQSCCNTQFLGRRRRRRSQVVDGDTEIILQEGREKRRASLFRRLADLVASQSRRLLDD